MSQRIEVNEAASGSTVKLANGDQLHISLPETRTAGYRWQVVSPASAIYRIEDSGFEPAAGVGGTGLHGWTLKALKSGTALLAMDYGRSWGSTPAAQQFKLTIKVGE
jgi:predicted secreted protein